MGFNFAYADPEYRKKQSDNTRVAWRLGKFDFKKTPPIKKLCGNPKCNNIMLLKPHETLSRKYCSRKCSALVNNPNRKVSEITKQKISEAIKGTHPKTTRFFPKIEIRCKNPRCSRIMSLAPWLAKKQRYCSNECAMAVIGRMTTSPKASKGKPGIRTDVSPTICFYSTWEANIARVFNLINLKWVYAPKIFDLREHTYRPDFYLPDFDTYVEVKNFMGEYSLNRDTQFRKLYPNTKLDLILKEEYMQIKANYKYFIRNWEY
ncbi:MAG: NUMOD3 domain-containing DNA-binding protein [Patescibacteria group bacterium]